MRITLEPTTDGRWQIWLTEWPEDAIPKGEWGGTYTVGRLPGRVKQLVTAVQSANLAELRRIARGQRS